MACARLFWSVGKTNYVHPSNKNRQLRFPKTCFVEKMKTTKLETAKSILYCKNKQMINLWLSSQKQRKMFWHKNNFELKGHPLNCIPLPRATEPGTPLTFQPLLKPFLIHRHAYGSKFYWCRFKIFLAQNFFWIHGHKFDSDHYQKYWSIPWSKSFLSVEFHRNPFIIF